MVDLNKIVDHYKVQRRGAERELKLLKARIKNVPISLVRLQMEIDDICKHETIETALDVRAELYQPDTRMYLLDELIRTRKEDDYIVVVDDICEKMLLPYPILTISGESFADDFTDAMDGKLGDIILPDPNYRSAKVMSHPDVSAVAITFERGKHIHYIEMVFTDERL